jgi:ATP-dependent RNA helicase RhlE
VLSCQQVATLGKIRRDIRKILAILPPSRQTLMFSATFSKAIQQLANTLLKSPRIESCFTCVSF